MRAFEVSGEPLDFLRKYKARRAGTWTPESAHCRSDAFDLACYYRALGRLPEAEEAFRWAGQMPGAVGPVRGVRTLLAEVEAGLVGRAEARVKMLAVMRRAQRADCQGRALRMLALLADSESYEIYRLGLSGTDPLLSACGESNQHVRRFKLRREGKWNFIAWGELAVMLLTLGRPDEVYQLADRLVERSQPDGFLVLRAAAFLRWRAGEAAAARALFQPVLESAGGLALPQAYLGSIDPSHYWAVYWGWTDWHLDQVESSGADDSQRLLLQLAHTIGTTMDLWLRARLAPQEFGWFPATRLIGQIERGRALLYKMLNE